MKTFEELKEELLQRAKDADACREGYVMGLRSESRQDLLEAITKNWSWVLKNKVVDAKYLKENFTEEELSEAGIYTRGCHEVRTDSFVCGSGAVEAYGNATVKVCDSGVVVAHDNVTVIAYDNGTVVAHDNVTVIVHDNGTVKACNNGEVDAYNNAKVEAYDNATVEAFNNVTVKAFDDVTVTAYGSGTVEAWNRAMVEAYNSVTVKAHGNGAVEAHGDVIVTVYDNATVEAHNNSYVEDYTGNKNIRPQSGHAIVKDYYNHRIYIRKGSFEVIEVE